MKFNFVKITGTAACMMLLSMAMPCVTKAGSIKMIPVIPALDTVPASTATPATPAQKTNPPSSTVSEVVKQVPKSRKQVKPIALPPTNVKTTPVKPKIIKPVIKKVTGLVP